MIEKNRLDILRRVVDEWGAEKQIVVAMEELSELAALIAKYQRYSDKNEAEQIMKKEVTNELADVYIVLEHIRNIFNLNDNDVDHAIDLKLERLDRWLSSSNSITQSLVDRDTYKTETEEKRSCSSCKYYNRDRRCYLCSTTDSFEIRQN